MEAETKNPLARSPTLDTVIMVEKFIEEHSGEFNRTEIWKNLPRKVMWQTYLVILDYLQSVNKIAIDRRGIVGYIWSPELAKRFAKRKRYLIAKKKNPLKETFGTFKFKRPTENILKEGDKEGWDE